MPLCQHYKLRDQGGLNRHSRARCFPAYQSPSINTCSGITSISWLLVRIQGFARLADMAEAKKQLGSLLSRRNLPRASHACQRCRAKKARCDQRQPCANCTKYIQECTYGPRRRNGPDRRAANSRQRGRERGNTPENSLSLHCTPDNQDETLEHSGNLEKLHGPARTGLSNLSCI